MDQPNASGVNSLVIEHVDAGYGSVRALEDVSLRVDAGETVALLGTNGNGKSTVMKCILGLVKPTRGRIVATIDGTAHDLVGMSTVKSSTWALPWYPKAAVCSPN